MKEYKQMLKGLTKEEMIDDLQFLLNLIKEITDNVDERITLVKPIVDNLFDEIDLRTEELITYKNEDDLTLNQKYNLIDNATYGLKEGELLKVKYNKDGMEHKYLRVYGEYFISKEYIYDHLTGSRPYSQSYLVSRVRLNRQFVYSAKNSKSFILTIELK